LPADNQRRASSKDQNLNEDADELGEADQRGIAIGGGELQGEHALVATAPTGQEAREHPHRVKSISVADGLISALDIGDRQTARVLEGRAGDEFVDDRERQQHDRRSNADHSQDGVHQPDHGEKDRRPRRVENSITARTAENRSHLRKISERLRIRRASINRRAQAGADELGGQPPIQPSANSAEHFAAHHLQQAENQHRDAGDDRQ
jgi:hypothetical protein